jgi:anti-sigma factor ChrR (cupin superfamily)
MCLVLGGKEDPQVLEGLGKQLWKWELYGGVRPLEFPIIEKVWVTVRAAAQHMGPVVYPILPQRAKFAE